MNQTVTDANALMGVLTQHAPATFTTWALQQTMGIPEWRIANARSYMIHNLLPGSGYAFVRAPGWEYGLTNALVGGSFEDQKGQLRWTLRYTETRAQGIRAQVSAGLSAFPRTRGLAVLERRADNLAFEAKQVLESIR